jgi:TATA-binding protein-associated factor Taf7
MTEPVRMLLADAARLLGTTPDALRKKVKRGQMLAVRDNAGRLLVWVDPPAEPGQVSSRPAVVQARQAGQVDGLASQESTLVQSLRDHIETLKAQLAETRQERERDRADHAAELERIEKRLIEERDATRDEAQEARAEADHAKADQVRMARDVAVMFDELKALADRHAEMHGDRAQLQAKVDRLTTDLEQARRPWWRRLIGR